MNITNENILFSDENIIQKNYFKDFKNEDIQSVFKVIIDDIFKFLYNHKNRNNFTDILNNGN